MGTATRATDWRVNGLAQVSGGAGAGGGVFYFVFKSHSAKVKKEFVFVGGGIGGGLKRSPSIASGSLSPASFSRIHGDMAFSADDLDGAGGRVTQLGASFMVGYSLVFISAFTGNGTLFHSQSAHGWSGGVGLSGVVIYGVWAAL